MKCTLVAYIEPIHCLLVAERLFFIVCFHSDPHYHEANVPHGRFMEVLVKVL